MKNVVDEIVQHSHRYKLTPVIGEADTFDFERKKGVVTEIGTTYNRAVSMGQQGFIGQETTVNPDGSITQINSDGDTMHTSVGSTGAITETFTSGGVSISKRTTVEPSGKIKEEML